MPVERPINADFPPFGIRHDTPQKRGIGNSRRTSLARNRRIADHLSAGKAWTHVRWHAAQKSMWTNRHGGISYGQGAGMLGKSATARLPCRAMVLQETSFTRCMLLLHEPCDSNNRPRLWDGTSSVTDSCSYPIPQPHRMDVWMSHVSRRKKNIVEAFFSQILA